MKVVMTQAVCPEGMRLLDGLAEVYVADNPDPNNYLSQMQDADALIVRIAKCDANVILNSPKLKVIGRTGVGYDSVDVAEATRRGIPVVITRTRGRDDVQPFQESLRGAAGDVPRQLGNPRREKGVRARRKNGRRHRSWRNRPGDRENLPRLRDENCGL